MYMCTVFIGLENVSAVYLNGTPSQNPNSNYPVKSVELPSACLGTYTHVDSTGCDMMKAKSHLKYAYSLAFEVWSDTKYLVRGKFALSTSS